jgi:hypothetical protein
VKHRAALYAFLPAVGLLLVACGGGETTPATGVAATPTSAATVPPTAARVPVTTAPADPAVTAPQPPTTPAPRPSPTPPPTTTAPPPPTTEAGPLRIVVDVEDGVVTGEERVVVDRGTEIELTVTSNRADEVHVHGYDYKADVDAATPAVIVFVADLPGIYEIELEDSHLVLLELEVR